MKKIKLFKLLALFVVLITSINQAWAGTSTTNINEESDEIMFVAAMTNSSDTYYSTKYLRAWQWNGSSDQVISSPEYIQMTSADYGGVHYCKLNSNWILNNSYTIKYALTTAASWTDAWEKNNADWTAAGNYQFVMWRTATNTDATYEAFTPLKLTKITYPDAITEGEEITVNVFGTGGFPWFYKAKLGNSAESKKYNLVVTNKAGTEIASTTFTYSLGSVGIDWTPASTSDNELTFTLSDNDNINSVSYTHTFTVNASPDPTIAWAASTPVSTYSLVSGESVTLNVTRSNSSESITYMYKIGTGSWNTIETTTNTSCTYTLTNTGATATYYFKAILNDGTPAPETSSSSAVTVYGKKTIHVRNTNDWDDFNVYRYNSNEDKETTWPGTTTIGITAADGQWYDVVMTSRYEYFIFNDGNSNQISGSETYTYTSSISDGGYYVIGEGTGTNLSFTSSYAPTAPSVTTAAATSVATTSVQFNASSVAANRDAITAYGFKWGTTSACSDGTVTASNLGTGTTFSATKSSLTNGTTYYFKAYATNGQGTTYGDPVSVRTKFITTITLDQEGGSGGTTSVTATEGSAMPSGMTAPGKTGYTFGGYYASAGGSGKQYYTSSMTSANNWDMAASTATIHAKWTANPYTITLKKHNEESDGSVSVTYDATTGLTSGVTPPERTGYTFGGYYTEEDGKGTQLIDEDGEWQTGNAWINASSEWKHEGDVELHAKWTANNYTVSFNVNGGTASTPDSKEVTYDAAYGTLPGGMTYDSKQFIGWYTDPDDGEGDLITAETTVSTASNHTLYAHYESVYSVNVQFKCGDDVLYPSTSVNASSTSLSPTITAPAISGYEFDGWTETTTTYVTFADEDEATTTITTSGSATIVANYTVVPTVYFKNNLGWDSVFVSFDCSFVAGKENVPSNNGKPYYRMTQIGSTDIYYCVIPTTYTTSDYAGWRGNIAFDNTNYGSTGSTTHTGTWSEFYGGECTGRGDFDPKATMYIPYDGDTETRNTCTYYKTGCWIKYNSTESGYQVNMNEMVTGENADTLTVKLTAPVAGSFEFSAKLNLKHANYSYGFKLYKDKLTNNNDLWYTNTGAISAATDDLPWHFWAGSTIDGTTQRCELHTEALGDYTITVSFATGRPEVNVEYPTVVGDWRLAYNDRIAWSGDAHDGSWYIYSRVVKAKTNAEDLVSFYVSKAVGASAHVELQKCTYINPTTAAETWEKQGDDLDLSGITETGFYNFKVTQDGSKVASASYDGAYSGNFYIRTDASDGGWSNYKSSGKNLMTYSEYAEANSGFTHYFMRFVSRGSNIKFCVANDYSDCLTEYCISDSYTNEYIEADGNVRFMWDQRTNKVSRAYISGSSVVSDRFLVLEGDSKLFNEAGNSLTGVNQIYGLNENEMKFTDDQNWIYEATVKAQPKAKVKLTAKYNNKIQYFYGDEGTDSSDSVLLLDGTGTDKYKMRIVYDFKTNRLIKAFIPDGAISADLAIDADMMIIREHQEDAQQITFNGGSLSKVKTVYGAMKFNKYTVNGKEKTGGHAATGDSRYKRDLFYISFPFDVKLSEAFGFGTYGQHWIIEYYDGKGRAANGYWADSESNWKFVMPAQRKDFTMMAFEGYILALDLDEMTESSSVWNNGVEDVYVYFPSSAEVEDIEATNRRIFIDQTGYKCNIGPRFSGGDDRTTKDSYWHCIGVPSFANYSSTLYDGENSGTRHTIDWTNSSMPYLYEWLPATNGLRVTESSTFSFKATWSYMVQYAGDSIYWSTVNVTPAASVAARLADTPDREYKLVLQSEEQTEDQTFVRMTDDENVSTGFEFNYDLSKEMNKNRANIYTLISTTIDSIPSITEAAANVQPHPLATTIVPVGVKIAANGEYTFSMPEGTNGGDVWLIDNANSSRTNLGLMDYTVNLTTGTYEGRFSLEFPVQNVVTEIENAANANANANADVRKVFVGGRLYILRDGKAYDATGAQVR